MERKPTSSFPSLRPSLPPELPVHRPKAPPACYQTYHLNPTLSTRKARMTPQTTFRNSPPESRSRGRSDLPPSSPPPQHAIQPARKKKATQDIQLQDLGGLPAFVSPRTPPRQCMPWLRHAGSASRPRQKRRKLGLCGRLFELEPTQRQRSTTTGWSNMQDGRCGWLVVFHARERNSVDRKSKQFRIRMLRCFDALFYFVSYFVFVLRL